jgi:hypothetical protein
MAGGSIEIELRYARPDQTPPSVTSLKRPPHHHPQITYQTALTAVFIESFIFLAISLTGLRGRMIELVPKHIMLGERAPVRPVHPPPTLAAPNEPGPAALV